MKKWRILILALLSFSFIIISQLSIASAEEVKFSPPASSECFPEYICGPWGGCADGLQVRTCSDKACGRRNIIERRFCDKNCVPQISCTTWGACTYTQKTDDLFKGKISFDGYHTRFCKDTTSCADDFAEEEKCEESYNLEIRNIVECGRPYLAAIDPASQRPLAKINLDSWNISRLDIIFSQDYSLYCPTCYDGVQDGAEGGIDCGGQCKSCAYKSQVPHPYFLLTLLWGLTVMFSIMSIKEYLGYNKLLAKENLTRRRQK
ncbi:MAG: hypothetical protein Q7S74_06115 [Nanoarchaeota archaeon]|nr:hypothetical protein [Nanoarchaeota archaeon]